MPGPYMSGPYISGPPAETKIISTHFCDDGYIITIKYVAYLSLISHKPE